jgi:acyl-CoA dehydrogenase
MNVFGTNVVVKHGSEEMRQEVLPEVSSGRMKVAFGVTEPSVGLDTTNLKTRAVRRGDDWVVPPAQRATETSLRARLTAAALARNQALTDENARLRRQLARALGDQRSTRTRSGNDPAP